MTRAAWRTCAACLLTAACALSDRGLTPGQRRVVVASVDSAMHAFEHAEQRLDVGALVSMIAPVPDFHIWNDGRRVDYETLTNGVLGGFKALRSVQGGFDGIEVTVLARNAAAASATFHEIVTDTSGTISLVSGVATYVWQKRGDRWQIVGGQVQHGGTIRP